MLKRILVDSFKMLQYHQAMNEIKLHYYQKALLKKLVFQPTCKFSELIIEGLESEHMNYHLKQLIDFELVIKLNDQYTLTDKGKDYCNLMDDDIASIEKQPKTSILIRAMRKNPQTGEVEHLVNKRLRQPYYGKVGGMTGKIRFGESAQDAAKRELYEETGLIPTKIQLVSIYRKIRKRKNNEPVQDVFMYTFLVTDLEGDLIEKTEFQENFWITQDDVKSRKDLDFFDDYTFPKDHVSSKGITYTENIGIAEGF